MPRGDGTGPLGLGPMTGRGLGYCAGNVVPGFMVPGPGLGLALGRGRFFGRGFARFYGFGRGFAWRANLFVPNLYVPISPISQVPIQSPYLSIEQEKIMLEQNLNFLVKQIELIKKRLSEIEKELQSK